MRFLLAVATFLGAIQVSAHMVTYKDGIALNSMMSPDFGIFKTAYTFHPRFSVSYEYLSWKNGLHLQSESDLSVAQVNALVKRWYSRDSQGNIYAGIGGGEDDTFSYQVEADWEDRKYYIVGGYRVLDTSQADRVELVKARLGFAPYVANTGALHTWLIAEYMKNDLMDDKESLTPFIRMFHQNILIELGYSFDHQFRFNFMIHL